MAAALAIAAAAAAAGPRASEWFDGDDGSASSLLFAPPGLAEYGSFDLELCCERVHSVPYGNVVEREGTGGERERKRTPKATRASVLSRPPRPSRLSLLLLKRTILASRFSPRWASLRAMRCWRAASWSAAGRLVDIFCFRSRFKEGKEEGNHRGKPRKEAKEGTQGKEITCVPRDDGDHLSEVIVENARQLSPRPRGLGSTAAPSAG